MKTLIRTFFAACLLAAAANAVADGAALYAAKACIACHGPEGRMPINDNTPILSGQKKGYLVQQILDIKSGERNNALTAQMKPLVANLSEADIDAISEYLSGLPGL